MTTKLEFNQRRVRSMTEYLRQAFTRVGNRYKVTEIEEDQNAPPGGTSDYEGRFLVFSVTDNGRTYRIGVEDVTIDGENEA